MKKDLEDIIADKAAEDSIYAVAWVLMRASGEISGSIRSLQESLRSDHPLMGETLNGVAGSLSEIAQAIEAMTEAIDNK